VRYTNLSGNNYSIDSLRYLISDIRIDDFDGNFKEIDQYQLMDLYNDDGEGIEFSVDDSVLKASYKSISFYMGFLDEENVNNGDYPILDEEEWAFPPIIDGKQAGGYYAFQMFGQYIPMADTVPTGYDIQVGSKALVENGSNLTYKPNPIIGSLKNSDFIISESNAKLEIRFNVANVFNNDGGNLLNLDLYNTSFTTEPAGTEIVSLNLKNAFSLGDVVQGSTE